MLNKVIIFTSSFSALAFEVLLVRLFGIAQWNNLSFMVISIALFGFTASGILINIAAARKKSFIKYINEILLFFSFVMLISFLYINNIPLDFFRLSTNPVQIAYLILSFLILSLPFLGSGLITGTLYASTPEKAGSVYFANMSGSALGTLFPLLALHFLNTEIVIFISILFPLLIIFITNKTALKIYSLVLFLAALLLYIFLNPVVTINPSPYKLLSQYEQMENMTILHEKDTLKARITHILSPYIRFAPGLSLKFTGSLPEQNSIIADGDSGITLYHKNSYEENFIKYTLPYAGYNLLSQTEKPDNILIIQKGGGTGVYSAINTANINSITVLDEYPEIIRIMKSHYNNPVINYLSINARLFLAGSNTEYDLIQIDYWGSSVPGMLSLNEEYLFTEEAFKDYLLHLTKNGMIVISRRILMPPCDSLKLISTANKAFNSLGLKTIDKNLIILRSWDCFTMLIFKSPVTNTQIETVSAFALNLNFDTVYYPGITEQKTNKYNLLDYPVYYEAVTGLLSDENFTDSYILNIYPQNDNTPYHNRLLKWDRICQLINESGNRFFSIILSGEMILVFIFLSALFICIFLLILPLIFSTSKATGFLLYFLLTGAGFMFLEMAFLKVIQFLYGDPVLSFSVVLAVLLFFSGLGGKYSEKPGTPLLKKILAVIIILSVILFIFFSFTAELLLGFNDIIRILISILILAAVSFFIGFPFPMALRLFLKKPSDIAYGWAANGSSSVLISILAVFIAMNTGINSLFLFSAGCYCIAFLCIFRQN